MLPLANDPNAIQLQPMGTSSSDESSSDVESGEIMGRPVSRCENAFENVTTVFLKSRFFIYGMPIFINLIDRLFTNRGSDCSDLIHRVDSLWENQDGTAFSPELHWEFHEISPPFCTEIIATYWTWFALQITSSFFHQSSEIVNQYRQPLQEPLGEVAHPVSLGHRCVHTCDRGVLPSIGFISSLGANVLFWVNASHYISDRCQKEFEVIIVDMDKAIEKYFPGKNLTLSFFPSVVEEARESYCGGHEAYQTFMGFFLALNIVLMSLPLLNYYRCRSTPQQ